MDDGAVDPGEGSAEVGRGVAAPAESWIDAAAAAAVANAAGAEEAVVVVEGAEVGGRAVEQPSSFIIEVGGNGSEEGAVSQKLESWVEAAAEVAAAVAAIGDQGQVRA